MEIVQYNITYKEIFVLHAFLLAMYAIILATALIVKMDSF